MHDLIIATEATYKKEKVVDVRSGDTVRVTQRIKETNKERLQVFEGLVIRVKRRHSLTYQILVRKIASGVAVEKGFLMHSPNLVKVEIVKRAKVRRNYLSYMRQRIGKAARLKNLDFDKSQIKQITTILAPSKPKEVDQKSAKKTNTPQATDKAVVAQKQSTKAESDLKDTK